eukprot:TRINITY_DN7073_c0_g1_i1.p1 TRINITY_DN7073_c0_g1~~TRINITY_DN7073_c0_g1_i1.p1  ORF type:complete len:175 (+),score=30.79 TRINITY_DN7073_c0_g1_i1:39-563(+)
MGDEVAAALEKRREEVLSILNHSNRKIKWPQTPSLILEPFLYLGSATDATDIASLDQHGITHILNLAAAEVATAGFYGDTRKEVHIQAQDDEEYQIHQHFDECFNFIDEAKSSGGKVLVHCKAGVSRSASVVVAYVMKEKKMKVSEAIQFVLEKRSCISPNEGFVDQLLGLEMK